MVGLLVQATGLLLDSSPLTVLGGLALVAAGGLWLVQLALWFRHRARREIDPGIAYLMAGTGFLGTGIVLGAVRLTAGGFDPRAWAAYAVVVLVGWCTLFTLGIAHRIVPFLSWLHLFGGMSRGTHAPPVTALVHRGMAWASLALLAVGTTLTAVGIHRGDAPIAGFGGLALAGGVLLVAAQFGRGYWLWRSTPPDPISVHPSTKTHRPTTRGVVMNEAKSIEVPRLDVRPTIAAGGEPFGEILAAADQVAEGGILEVLAPFEPIPLYAALSRRGFAHRTTPLPHGEHLVAFIQTGITPDRTLAEIAAAQPQVGPIMARHGFDMCCGGAKAVEVAARAHGVDLDQFLGELQGVVVGK